MNLASLLPRLNETDSIMVFGRVVNAVGLTVEGTGPPVTVGQSCHILNESGEIVTEGEVVGFRQDRVMLMPYGDMQGIRAGDRILYVSQPSHVRVGPRTLGRVLDGLGRVIDGRGPIPFTEAYPLSGKIPTPFERDRIAQPMDLGLRSVNALLTCGIGQKLGIFAGSGVGKSVLLGMISRHASADVNVIALIGERGREVKEFIERELGPEGLQRSVVIAATSDQSPLVRLRGALLATAIAEYFRDQGKHVLLMMDSVTRLAHAQREIGLAVGEPPTAKGYPPSVFNLLPKVLERVGPARGGSITGLYTVLVDGDDLSDPIADAVRAILDGHIILSRNLATQGHFPAIDVLGSISRVMSDVVPSEHLNAARSFLEIMSVYQNSEELINLGAYQPGSNVKLDVAITMRDAIRRFLTQHRETPLRLEDSVHALYELLEQAQHVSSSQASGKGQA
ncbi:MAG: flagellum-specific ATP synthase FliI [Nitrospirales bacterium]|nr:MAG: flagellum-specific ATP synthase FliI [Nitrospirales bacterium]